MVLQPRKMMHSLKAEKLEKHLCRSLFCKESSWITSKIYLNEIQQNGFARKIKKALTTIIKENLYFKQLWLNYLNKQKKQQKKNKKRTPKISNKLLG